MKKYYFLLLFIGVVLLFFFFFVSRSDAMSMKGHILAQGELVGTYERV